MSKGHAGLTLSNIEAGPGVRVTELKKRDIAFRAGLRLDDVLVCVRSANIQTQLLVGGVKEGWVRLWVWVLVWRGADWRAYMLWIGGE